MLDGADLLRFTRAGERQWSWAGTLLPLNFMRQSVLRLRRKIV